MIDLHSHVLPGLDDGPATLEESVAMVKIAAQAGTTDLVATPHANLEFSYQPHVVEEKIAELNKACGEAVRLHRGCDLHLSYDNIVAVLEDPTRYTINGKNYLLVEFPDILIAKTTEEVFHRMRTAGLVPVITHPERNYLLHTRLERIAGWIEIGCLVQVTAQSFLGRFGRQVRRVCRELMERRLVHIVASDAHDAVDRPPRLDQAYRHVARRYGEAWAERLFVTNPAAALDGEPPPSDPLPPPQRRWMPFWR